MKRTRLYIMILICILPACSPGEQAEFRITDYGARRDGPVNTEAIQSAIDACHEQGGGKVIIPTGTWYSGTIRLRSHVHLFLESGAVLKGSQHLEDFEHEGKRFGLLFAYNARNITISGEGTIDGNGTLYHDADRPHVAKDFNREYIRQGNAYMKQ